MSLGIAEYSDAVFIFAVLQANAVVGAFQEWKAESSAEALNAMIPDEVMVRRGAKRHVTVSADLVPGDIVLLQSGDLMPADARLITAHDVTVDESSLTGESVPVGKVSDLVLAEATAVADRRNMLHAGTTVLAGRAAGIVIQTGLHTELGRIAQAMAGIEAGTPPLVIRLRRLTRVIGIVVVCAVAALAVAEFMRGMALAEVFFVAVALAVSAIPEGLPVAITVALSVGSARMARRNVIVRSLPAVEGLGACTLIASDKTGTLTVNQLTVKRLVLPRERTIEVTGEGYVPEGTLRIEGELVDHEIEAAARRLASAGSLCNEATFRIEPQGYVHFGDTVDVAFLVLAKKLGAPRPAVLARYPETGFVPFEPHLRYAASFNDDDGRTIAHVKGAAEVVIPMCQGIDRDRAIAQAEDLSAKGFRVLAVAAGAVAAMPPAEGATSPLKGLEFLGLVGLIDPLRAEVPGAVERCRSAGIQVEMVTGDHPATALTIARELGITLDSDDVVTGAELSELMTDPNELDLAVASGRVFARVEPMQKHTIVTSHQRAGHFVAVTGDGVNDAPALRAAHIGVAMGRQGTDVARGAADLILADDNFASIVNGVEEGRIAYDNVRKVVYLLIATGAAEIVLFFLAFAAGLPLPLFAAQLLWLNLVTNGIQDVALAFEGGDPGVLARSPRPPEQPIFDRPMIEQTAISGAFIGVVAFAFFHWALAAGWSEAEARNVMLLLMVFFENVHVFNCRSETRSVLRVPIGANPLLVAAVVATQSIHIGAMYVPGLNNVLGIAPVSVETWLSVAPIALSLILVMEVYKAFRARKP